MSESMIERVAENIAMAHKLHGRSFDAMARAAIEAMREPTDAMIEALTPIGPASPWECYEAAIDAALAEGM